MIRKLLCIACLALWTLSAFAQFVPIPREVTVDNTVIGTSDLIVIGTITDVVVDNPGDLTNGNPMSSGKGSYNTTTSIQVDQILKGGKVENINIKYSSFNDYKLGAKQQKIFLLKRTQGGFTLTAYAGVLAPDQLEKVTKAIKELPLKITSEEAVGPLFFGKEIIVNAKVMNTGATPIELPQYGFSVETYSFSPLVKDYLPITTQMVLPEGEKPDFNKTYTIDAGGERTIKLRITCTMPQSWQLFTKDTYLQMPIALRLTVRSNPAKDANNKPIPGSQCAAATPWSTVMIGYALPDDINVEDGNKD